MKGDAKKTNTPSSKNFQLTFNEIEKFDDVLAYLRGLKPNYLLAAKESAPTTGHAHIHCYVQFPNCRRLSLKKLEGAHVEKCFGSPEQNQDYVKKDGDILVEEGALRACYMPSIGELKKMPAAQRDTLPAVLFNICNKLNNEDAKYFTAKDFYKGKITVFWLYGPSGAGKTRAAIKYIRDNKFNSVKFDGSFWHGVTEDCSIALYDDFRDSHMKPSELINFIDYNVHTMNVKGGTVKNNYKEIYITSIQDPEKIYSNMEEEYKEQWLRRITRIEKYEILNK